MVILPWEKSTNVLFSHSKLRRQRSPRRSRSSNSNQSKTPPRAPLRRAAAAIRHPPIHRGLRLARPRWLSLTRGNPRHGRSLHALRPGIAPFPAPPKRAPVRAQPAKPPAHAPVPDHRRRHHALHPMGANRLPHGRLRQVEHHRLHESSHQQHGRRSALRNRHLRIAFLLKDQDDDLLRRRQPGNSPRSNGGQALRLHLPLVRLRRSSQRDHPGLLLEKQSTAPVPLRNRTPVLNALVLKTLGAPFLASFARSGGSRLPTLGILIGKGTTSVVPHQAESKEPGFSP